MATNIFLPQWGMGMQEATIIKWLKKEGDIVKKGDPLVEVESSKVNAEVESSTDGYLIKSFSPFSFVSLVTKAVSEAI